MKKVFLGVFLSLFSMLLVESDAQNLDYSWARNAGGTYIESGEGMATDASGNVIVVGTFFSASISFGSISLSKDDSTAASMFVAKYSPDGDIIWAKRASTPSAYMETYAYAVTTDISGNIYVSGDLWGDTISFDSQTIVLPEPYEQASFLVKYDPNGSFLWARMGLGGRGAYSVAIDGNGDLYISGIFNNEINFDNHLIQSSGACYGIFLAKYNEQGLFLWAKASRYSFAGSGTPNAASNGLCTDLNNDVYITGLFGSDTLWLDDHYVSNTYSVRNVFIAKYDTDGNALWAKGAESRPSLFKCSGNSLIAADNSIYLAGEFEGDSVFFENHLITRAGDYSDMFLCKYDPLGNALWAQSMGTESIDYGSGLAADGAGHIYVAGTTNGAYFQVNSTAVDTLIGGNNAAIVRFDGDGHFLQLISPVNGSSAQSMGRAMAMDGNEDIFLCGSFNHTVYFGPDSLTSTNFWDDVFVCKLNPMIIGNQEVSLQDPSVRLFPNPCTDFIAIAWTGKQEEVLELKIYHLNGALLHRQTIHSKQAQINTSGFNPGIYMVSLKSGNFFEQHKLVIQR